MKVSIVMCAYNAGQFIEDAIKSIFAQTYTNWELIISNDASTDNTSSVIHQFMDDPRVKLQTQKQNLGCLKNKNSAMSLVTGDLVTLLDADDLCPPDRIEKQVAVFETHGDIKICGTNYRTIGTNGQERDAAKEYEADFLVKEIMDEYPFWFPSIMFRQELLQEFGLFPEYFDGIAGEDNYWTFKVNQRYAIYFLKDVLYYYRVYPSSFTNVYDNPRKMLATEILNELYRQRLESGTDWLEQGAADKMKAFEESILADNILMAEKFRTWAAKSVDNKNWSLARELLMQSYKLNKRNSVFKNTLFYYFRKRYLQPILSAG